MLSVYVGNPLMEEMDLKPVNRGAVLKKNGIGLSCFPLICAMPGSRKGEIEKIWPLFLKASRIIRESYPDAAFIVPKPQGLEYDDYVGLSPEDSVFFVEAPAFDLRKICDAAWVKSGTGTLETALLKTPMVVVYKVAAVTGFLAKRFLKIKNVSLVNLLAGETVVRELLQEKAETGHLVKETLSLLENKAVRGKQIKAFEKIKKSISNPPKASQTVAKEMMKLLKGI
jgi:lipid-A-disaccharide synthase